MSSESQAKGNTNAKEEQLINHQMTLIRDSAQPKLRHLKVRTAWLLMAVLVANMNACIPDIHDLAALRPISYRIKIPASVDAVEVRKADLPLLIPFPDIGRGICVTEDILANNVDAMIGVIKFGCSVSFN